MDGSTKYPVDKLRKDWSAIFWTVRPSISTRCVPLKPGEAKTRVLTQIHTDHFPCADRSWGLRAIQTGLAKLSEWIGHESAEMAELDPRNL